ncbi:MAG TPA: phosphoglycolate phosphatase [Polyangia bacterium]|jgi:phosphoglycolate phosphatase|nr:phosphoglycolate phosphatase [Polyangia bacterium]
MPRFSLLLFDLDGTLVDTAEDIATALNATLAEAGVAPLPTERVIGFIGNGATRLIERALPAEAAGKLTPAALVPRFKAHYAAHVCQRSRVYPGVVELLGRAAAAGIPLAVLTNKPGDLARALLAALGIGEWFRHIIGDGDGFARKPAPEAVHWLCTQHQLPPSSALFVGDGVPDVQVARAAGCSVAAATWGYSAREALAAEAPTFVVDDLTAVAALLFDR